MPWPWESDFWRANAPPPDVGAPGTGRESGWQLDAAFTDSAGAVHCFRRGRVCTARLTVGVSGRAKRSVDAVERLCAQLAEDGGTGSALLAVVGGRTPALSWSRWRPQSEAFPGIEWPRLDGAVRLDDDLVYMFFGGEFLAYDLTARRIRPGYPRALAGQWFGLWDEGIDAMVNPGRGKIYFFRGGACSRYDVARQRVEEGFPRAIGEVFPGLSWRRIDLAFCPGRAGELVFVRERQAVVYRDAEAARQLALAESEARARVEAVLNGEMSELAESLHQAWREDRSRGVTRTGVFDSLLADVRRHAELASLAASFAATAARISEDSIGRLGVEDILPAEPVEDDGDDRWRDYGGHEERLGEGGHESADAVELADEVEVEIEPAPDVPEAPDELATREDDFDDVEIEVDLEGLELVDGEDQDPPRPPPAPE